MLKKHEREAGNRGFIVAAYYFEKVADQHYERNKSAQLHGKESFNAAEI